MKGIVKWFDDNKGYGFIVCDQLNEEIFVHYSHIICDSERKTLTIGEYVEFELAITEEGYKAKNVKPIKNLE